jgi:hypothetical protein
MRQRAARVNGGTITFGVFLLLMAACAQRDASLEPTLSAEECAPEPDPSPEDSDPLCEVLCQVPGGVTECPAGTPCPTVAARKLALEGAASRSLCGSGEGAGARECARRR